MLEIYAALFTQILRIILKPRIFAGVVPKRQSEVPSQHAGQGRRFHIANPTHAVRDDCGSSCRHLRQQLYDGGWSL